MAYLTTEIIISERVDIQCTPWRCPSHETGTRPLCVMRSLSPNNVLLSRYVTRVRAGKNIRIG